MLKEEANQEANPGGPSIFAAKQNLSQSQRARLHASAPAQTIEKCPNFLISRARKADCRVIQLEDFGQMLETLPLQTAHEAELDRLVPESEKDERNRDETYESWHEPDYAPHLVHLVRLDIVRTGQERGHGEQGYEAKAVLKSLCHCKVGREMFWDCFEDHLGEGDAYDAGTDTD
jgi:hypothetical protein|mmetsp:Transcript_41240/g.54190  ORF Transcript_41240/g.54190 Transcript_41240/m.54190 type:complete len:175 (-) Transcript_41240:544-1068(-)